MKMIHIRTLTMLGLILVGFPLPRLGLGTVTIDSIVSGLDRDDASIEALVLTLPIDEADDLLRGCWTATASNNPSVAAKALELLAARPDVEGFYRKRVLINREHLKENGQERASLMVTLHRFRTRWALNLLGDVLQDPRPMTSRLPPEQLHALEESNQLGGALSNHQLAAGVMGRMKLGHWPLTKSPNAYDANDVARVQAWWEQHKGEPDSFFFEHSIAPKFIHDESKHETPISLPQSVPINRPSTNVEADDGLSKPWNWFMWLIIVGSVIGLLWLWHKRRS